MKALVVDDVSYSQIIVKKALEKLGIEVLAASSGPEALDAVRREQDIDLVITDLMMPGMDGLDLHERLLEQLRADPSRQNADPPRFILLTASPEPKLLQRAKQAGFLDIMVKPFDPKRLLQTLNQHFGNRFSEEIDCTHALKALTNTLDQIIAAKDIKAASTLRPKLQDALRKLDVLAAARHTDHADKT